MTFPFQTLDKNMEERIKTGWISDIPPARTCITALTVTRNLYRFFGQLENISGNIVREIINGDVEKWEILAHSPITNFLLSH